MAMMLRSYADNLPLFLEDLLPRMHSTRKKSLFLLPPIITAADVDVWDFNAFDLDDMIMTVMLVSMKKRCRLQGIGHFLKKLNKK
jgi:hypothetical protein